MIPQAERVSARPSTRPIIKKGPTVGERPHLGVLPANAPADALLALIMHDVEGISPRVEQTGLSNKPDYSLQFPGNRHVVVFEDPSLMVKVGWVNPERLPSKEAARRKKENGYDGDNGKGKRDIKVDMNIPPGKAVKKIRGIDHIKHNGKWIPVETWRKQYGT